MRKIGSDVKWLVTSAFLLYIAVAALIFVFLVLLPPHPMLRPIRDMAFFALFLLGIAAVFSAATFVLEGRR